MNECTIPCPKCGHNLNDVLTIVTDHDGQVVGHVVHCRSCEHVWNDPWRMSHA